MVQITGYPVRAGGEFASEKLIFFFHLFDFFFNCIPVAVFLCSEFHHPGNPCFALFWELLRQKVGCAVLAPRTPEQDDPTRLHTFGLNLWAFGCQAGRIDTPLRCKCVRCTARGDLVLGWGLEGGNVIYSNGSG